MNRYRLQHVTAFEYDGPVSESYNEVRLRPKQDETQSCLSFRLTTEPVSKPSAHLDQFGNWVHRFNVLPEHRNLKIIADSVVLVQAPPPIPPQTRPLSEPGCLDEDLDEYYDLLAPTAYAPHLPELAGLVKEAESSGDGTGGNFALSAATLIHERFRYEKGATHVQSSIQDALNLGSGVCQDFAHLLLGVLRMRSLPARYVSGYLMPRPTAEPGANIEEMIGGQASHAWAEVFLAGAGWFGLDPTLGCPVSLQHVRVAYGRDYGDVAPVRGVYKGHAGQRLSVDVQVRPALDHEGWEHLQQTNAAPPQAPLAEEPQQQEQQQQ